jgi:transglutaminase-like putative cysteine protease
MLGYDTTVGASYNEVRMQPRERHRQQLRSMSLVTTPPSVGQTRIDYFGNVVHRMDVFAEHDALEILVHATVESSPVLEHRPSRWMASQLERDPRLEYVLSSPRVPLEDQTRQLWLEWTGGDRSFDSMLGCAQRINREFRYERGATTVDSSIDDLLRAGGGVCQDFTHLFLALARHAGWPTRYVSGYLGPTGEDTVAVGESHAWMEICGPEGRWVGIDPTHGRLAGLEHIQLAVGRDYGDVSPHRGLFYGGSAARSPEVSVTVTRVPALTDPRLTARTKPRQQMAQQQQ